VVLGEATDGATRLQTWLDEANVAARYPELATLSVVDYRVYPDGTTSCLPRPGGFVASGSAALAAGRDLCDGAMASLMAESIDNGGGAYIPETDRESGELLLLQSLLPGSDAELQTPAPRAHRPPGRRQP
jgi:hypothetical protein